MEPEHISTIIKRIICSNCGSPRLIKNNISCPKRIVCKDCGNNNSIIDEVKMIDEEELIKRIKNQRKAVLSLLKATDKVYYRGMRDENNIILRIIIRLKKEVKK